MTSHPQSSAVNRGGVNLLAESKPLKVFAKLFLDGTLETIQREIARLAEGRSLLDAVSDQAKRLCSKVSPGNPDKLDKYFSSVRQIELRLQAVQTWSKKPQPKVDASVLADVQEGKGKRTRPSQQPVRFDAATHGHPSHRLSRDSFGA